MGFRQGSLEDMVMLRQAFHGKSVWVSGHTGFKGSWLCAWLLELGARIHGFALPPPTQPALFDQLGLTARLHHEMGDVRDPAAVQRSLEAAQPDFVFHLAAQPLVRLSYQQPLETYATNVMGTAHVLEGIRSLPRPCTAVCITTDKCYENREWLHGYREEDPLGGHDPYSSSKAAAEIVIAAYRRSFFHRTHHRLASARAGNVIGGGDWAADRLVPDCMRCLARAEVIPVRNPGSTRPWQHVLEPLSGYLWLAARLAGASAREPRQSLEGAFNFGPDVDSNRSVAQVVEAVLRHWPGRWENRETPGAVHEAGRLHLSTDKAFHVLGWRPVWVFENAIARTVEWYRLAAAADASAPLPNPALQALTLQHVAQYTADARASGQPWAREVPPA